MTRDPAVLTVYDRHYEMTRAMLADRTVLELAMLALMSDPPADEAARSRAAAVADLLRERGA